MPVCDLMPLYTAQLREESKSPRTIRDYTRTINVLDRELPFGADVPTEEELRAWLWREGLAPASRRTYYAGIRHFYNWAYNKGILSIDPSANLTRPRAPRGLPRVATDDAVQRVLTEARQPYRLWAQLAGYAGLRCIEIYQLHREHVTEAMISVHLGKGAKSRRVPTHPVIWAAVQDLPPGRIVGVRNERRVSTNFKIYCMRSLGMYDMSLHRIRGWWATTGYRITKNIRAIQYGLGHEHLGTTAGYIAIDAHDLQDVIDCLPVYGDGAAAVSQAGARPTPQPPPQPEVSG